MTFVMSLRTSRTGGAQYRHVLLLLVESAMRRSVVGRRKNDGTNRLNE